LGLVIIGSETSSFAMDGPSDRKRLNKASNDSDAASQTSEEYGTTYVVPEQRKIGIAGAVFLILNKMIGTGSA
jgi:hypothetical protein